MKSLIIEKGKEPIITTGNKKINRRIIIKFFVTISEFKALNKLKNSKDSKTWYDFFNISKLTKISKLIKNKK